jgi:uncharacterized protein
LKTVALREQDLEALRRTLRRFPFIKEARIFGSRATGTARRASDIDLAVSAPSATPAEWADMREALDEAPVIYEIDLVRPEETASERLKQTIARDGVVIHP